MTQVKALVFACGKDAIGTAKIVWPGEQLGTWEVTVEGLEDAFFNKEQARVVFRYDGKLYAGDAQPTSVNQDLDGKTETFFVGVGGLWEVPDSPAGEDERAHN